MSQSFFKDLYIVELASVLAGPSVGKFFSELGATVVKIENKRSGGDVTRNWRIQGESSNGPSAYYASVNYGKKVEFIDLSDESDRSLLNEHLAKADLVISNYQDRVAKKWALDYADISRTNPGVIMGVLKGFKNTDRPAFDVVLQAETGWISMTGSKDAPAKLPVALIDILAGHQMKEAFLLAMIKKLKTGSGSYFECNLEQSSLASLANQATNVLMNDFTPQPIGTRHPNIAPYGDWFTTKDGVRFVLAIGSDKMWREFSEAISFDEGERYESNELRLEKRDLMVEEIQDRISQLEHVTLFDEFDRKGIPFGEIKNLKLVLSSDSSRELLLEENIDGRRCLSLSELAFTQTFLDQS